VSIGQVLIVDDEEDVIQPLKLRLETAGYQALTASDGAEALAMLRQVNVDLILTDLMMPNLDGLELTRQVRQNPRWVGVQVLLFSCHDDPGTRRLALELGAQDYLSKAVGARAIVSRVLEILDPGGMVETSPRRDSTGAAAERDLISQLHALSRSSAPTIDPGTRALMGIGVGQAGTAEDTHALQNLAESLERAKGPSRDRSGSVT
jgi:DNA-binding response OmpR family regulator